MSDEGRVTLEERMRGPQPRVWLIAVAVVLVIGLVGVLVRWTIAAATFIVDRAWWAWNGWAAVAGLAQILAASATLGTLIFFAIQLAMLRRQMRQDVAQRREDFERSLWPLVSIQILRKSTVLEGRTLKIRCRIHADGAGVVYNLVVNLRQVAPPTPQSSPGQRDTCGHLMNMVSGCIGNKTLRL